MTEMAAPWQHLDMCFGSQRVEPKTATRLGLQEPKLLDQKLKTEGLQIRCCHFCQSRTPGLRSSNLPEGGACVLWPWPWQLGSSACEGSGLCLVLGIGVGCQQKATYYCIYRKGIFPFLFWKKLSSKWKEWDIPAWEEESWGCVLMSSLVGKDIACSRTG